MRQLPDPLLKLVSKETHRILFRIMNLIGMNLKMLMRNFMRSFSRERLDEGGGSHLVEQEVVLKHVDLGGLGFGNLRIRNESLLAKWLWWSREILVEWLFLDTLVFFPPFFNVSSISYPPPPQKKRERVRET